MAARALGAGGEQQGDVAACGAGVAHGAFYTRSDVLFFMVAGFLLFYFNIYSDLVYNTAHFALIKSRGLQLACLGIIDSTIMKYLIL